MGVNDCRKKTMSKPLLMIVDDDRADRFLLNRLIARSDLDVDVAECFDGVQALEYFENVDQDVTPVPDLVLLDINMPRKNGHEFLEEYNALIQQRPELATRVVVMLTCVSRSDEERCCAYEFVVGKASKDPSNPEQLVRAISDALPR